jgi:hypothetical protein
LIIESKYVIKKKLAQGGFGKVYLAVDRFSNEQVIVKINAELDMNDNEFAVM